MKKKIITISTFLVGLLAPTISLAEAVDPATWLNTLFTNVLNKLVWPIFLGLAILMFIYAGYLYLTAQGEGSKIATANKTVIFAVIGIAVAIVAFSAVNIIKGIIGI